jgi:LAO/AO transport system kinase
VEGTGLFDVILIETVGAGQTEVAIVDLADTVVLVTVPGLGDAVQTIKAGLMEVADLFVVNMADRPGAAETARHLRLAAGPSTVVLQTTASEGLGIDELATAIDTLWQQLQEPDLLEDLRARKWRSDALLVAEAWIAECARQAPPAVGERMAASVGDLLSRSSDLWITHHLRATDEPGSPT